MLMGKLPRKILWSHRLRNRGDLGDSGGEDGRQTRDEEGQKMDEKHEETVLSFLMEEEKSCTG